MRVPGPAYTFSLRICLRRACCAISWPRPSITRRGSPAVHRRRWISNRPVTGVTVVELARFSQRLSVTLSALITITKSPVSTCGANVVCACREGGGSGWANRSRTMSSVYDVPLASDLSVFGVNAHLPMRFCRAAYRVGRVHAHARSAHDLPQHPRNGIPGQPGPMTPWTSRKPEAVRMTRKACPSAREGPGVGDAPASIVTRG